MKQAIEQVEVAIDVRVHHAGQIEFDIARLGEARAVAQKAQRVAVGDDAPYAVGYVQVFLHSGVGAPARGPAFVELIVSADDIYRRRQRIGARSVRNRKALITGGKRALEIKLIAERFK
jgi:hypothetical protein